MIHPCPKPRPRILDRVADKRELEAKDRAFRLAVWVRDGGKCRHCGRPVKHTITLSAEQGHVHHRHGSLGRTYLSERMVGAGAGRVSEPPRNVSDPRRRTSSAMPHMNDGGADWNHDEDLPPRRCPH